MVEKLIIDSEFITLGQALKILDLVSSGGQTKNFLNSNPILINGELDNRRGRKIRANDTLIILGKTYQVYQK